MQAQTKKIKIVTMSDTHDLHFRIDPTSLPQADIFIHAGDFTKVSTAAQLLRFREFLGLLPYKHKIVIAGNHDFGLDRARADNRPNKQKYRMGQTTVDTEEEIKKLKAVCTYLQHESVEVEGVKIFGSPYSLEFYDWGFMYKAFDGQKLWSSIPEGTDIVVTHGPPFGILDRCQDGVKAGCQALLERVMQIKPKVHIFGHIHEAAGVEQHKGVKFINASSVNVYYKMVNPPFQFEIQVPTKAE